MLHTAGISYIHIDEGRKVMKKNIFSRTRNSVVALLALAIILLVLTPMTAQAATSYWDYWYDVDWEDDNDSYWQNYWDDADEEDYYDYWKTSSSSKYLKLKKNSNSTYFKGIKGTRYAKYIDWCGRQKLFAGILKKGKKVDPGTKVPKWVVRKMLKNGYNGRVDMNVGKSKSSVTERYFCNLTSEIAGRMNYNLSWNGESPNGYMSLGDICYCYYQMAKTSNGHLYTNNYYDNY